MDWFAFNDVFFSSCANFREREKLTRPMQIRELRASGNQKSVVAGKESDRGNQQDVVNEGIVVDQGPRRTLIPRLYSERLRSSLNQDV